MRELKLFVQTTDLGGQWEITLIIKTLTGKYTIGKYLVDVHEYRDPDTWLVGKLAELIGD